MKLNLHSFVLPLQHDFRIARGSISSQRSLVVELEHNGVRGFGESTENTYYRCTVESMTEAISACAPEIESYSFGSPADL